MADRFCPKLPIIWGSETFTTLTSITARKVPDITATVTSHFLPGGRRQSPDSCLGRFEARESSRGVGSALHRPQSHFTLTTGTTDMPGLSR